MRPFLKKIEKPVILQIGCTQKEKRLSAIHPSHYRVFKLLQKTAETQDNNSIQTALEFTFDILWNLSQNVEGEYVSDEFRDNFIVLKNAFSQNRPDDACKTLSDMFLKKSVLNKVASNAVVQLMTHYLDNCARFMIQPNRAAERHRAASLLFNLYHNDDANAARTGLRFFRELLCVVPMQEDEKCFFKTERILPFFEPLDFAVRLLDQKEIPRACNEIGDMIYYGCMQHKKVRDSTLYVLITHEELQDGEKTICFGEN